MVQKNSASPATGGTHNLGSPCSAESLPLDSFATGHGRAEVSRGSTPQSPDPFDGPGHHVDEPFDDYWTQTRPTQGWQVVCACRPQLLSKKWPTPGWIRYGAPERRA